MAVINWAAPVNTFFLPSPIQHLSPIHTFTLLELKNNLCITECVSKKSEVDCWNIFLSLYFIRSISIGDKPIMHCNVSKQSWKALCPPWNPVVGEISILLSQKKLLFSQYDNTTFLNSILWTRFCPVRYVVFWKSLRFSLRWLGSVYKTSNKRHFYLEFVQLLYKNGTQSQSWIMHECHELSKVSFLLRKHNWTHITMIPNHLKLCNTSVARLISPTQISHKMALYRRKILSIQVGYCLMTFFGVWFQARSFSML